MTSKELENLVNSGKINDVTFLEHAAKIIAQKGRAFDPARTEKAVNNAIRKFNEYHKGPLGSLDFEGFEKFKTNPSDRNYLKKIYELGTEIKYFSKNPITPSKEYMISLKENKKITDDLFFLYVNEAKKDCSKSVKALTTFLQRKEKNVSDMNPALHQELIFSLLSQNNPEPISRIRDVYEEAENIQYASLEQIGVSPSSASTENLRELTQSGKMTDLRLVTAFCGAQSDPHAKQGARLFWKFISEKGKSLSTADEALFKIFTPGKDPRSVENVKNLYDFAEQVGYIPKGRKTIEGPISLEEVTLGPTIADQPIGDKVTFTVPKKRSAPQEFEEQYDLLFFRDAQSEIEFIDKEDTVLDTFVRIPADYPRRVTVQPNTQDYNTVMKNISTDVTSHRQAIQFVGNPTAAKLVQGEKNLADPFDISRNREFKNISERLQRRNNIETATREFRDYDVQETVGASGTLDGCAYAVGKRLIFAGSKADSSGERLTFFLPKPNEWDAGHIAENVSLKWDETLSITILKGNERSGRSHRL